jgi:hypothetical protein
MTSYKSKLAIKLLKDSKTGRELITHARKRNLNLFKEKYKVQEL